MTADVSFRALGICFDMFVAHYKKDSLVLLVNLTKKFMSVIFHTRKCV